MSNRLRVSVDDFYRLKNAFYKVVSSGSGEKIIQLLGKVKIDDPVACLCVPVECQKDPGELYRHINHRSYNRAFWELIPRGNFEELRLILKNDDKNDLVPRDLAKKLLKYFLIANGMQVDWI